MLSQIIKRILDSLKEEEIDIVQELKNDISARLQGVNTPEEAFQLKLEMNAVDSLFLRLSQIADKAQ